MNKQLIDVMNKNNTNPLRKQKDISTQTKTMNDFLKDYNISVPQITDYDYYKLELIYHSVIQKEHYENIFYNNYIDMYDYWNDLSYEEKKRQMQPNIDEMEEKSHSFVYEGQRIFIPILSIERNVFYRERLLMLQFKNHARVIRDFEEEIQMNYYGSLPFINGFSSLKYISSGKDSKFSLYSERVQALFIIDKNGTCVSTMYLPKDKEFDEVILKVISDYLFREDNVGCIEYLCAQEYGNKSCLHKLKGIRKSLLKKVK